MRKSSMFSVILISLSLMIAGTPLIAKGITTLSIPDITISVMANTESSFLMTVTDVNQRDMDIFFEDISGIGIEFRGNPDALKNIPTDTTLVQTVFVPEAAFPGQHVIRAIGLPSDMVEDIVSQFGEFPSIDQLPVMGYRYDDVILDVSGIAETGTPAQALLAGIMIDGPLTVIGGQHLSLSTTATYSDGSTREVTYETLWSEDSLYASINDYGILNTEPVTSDERLYVSAGYSEGDNARSDSRLVTITNSEIEEETVLYFPQFISGGGSSTEFILVNNCADEKSGSVIFYSNETPGNFIGEIIKSEPYSVAARDVSVFTWSDGINGNLQVGAVEVTQEGDKSCTIEGTEFFNALGSYTTVPAAVPGEAQQIFAFRNSTRDTGFAVYNPNDYDIEIEASFITGEESLETSFELGPNGHKACYLGELFADQQALIPDDVPGTLNFHSVGGEDFTLMGLFSPDLSANALVSLPTSPNALEE